MSDTDHARGTVPPTTLIAALRRGALTIEPTQASLLRDQINIARALCQTEAAFIAIFADQKDIFIARAGALPKEIPLRSSAMRAILVKNSSFESLDLLEGQASNVTSLVESPWYYRYCALSPFFIGDVLVGALGVADRSPRQNPISEAGWVALRAVARGVSHVVLNGRLRTSALGKPTSPQPDRHLRLAEGEGGVTADRDGLVGFFEVDVPAGTATLSPSLCRILSLPVRELFPVAAIKPCFPRTPSRRSFLEEITLQNDDVLDYKIRLGGNVTERPRWLKCQIGVSRDEQGRLTRAFGVVSDAGHDSEATRRYTLLALLGKELRHINESVDAFRIASRYLGVTLSADHVRCFHFDTAEGQSPTEFDGWSREGVAPTSIIRPIGPKARQYLLRGMILAVDDLQSAGWLLSDQPCKTEGDPQSCLIIPGLADSKLKHCVVIQSTQRQVWRVEDTYFARIIVDWVDAVSNLTEARRGQEFLYREMAHRLKNTLTVVQALARQSLRDCSDQSGVKSFERRVHALASANVSSMSRRSKKAALRDIAEDVLLLIAPLDRFSLNGPKVFLGPKTAGYLGLLLNELGTNAIKYGALSNDKGKVLLSWVLTGGEEDEDEILTIRWVETGGPRARQPVRKGFGSQMIYYGLGESCVSEVTFPQTGCQACFRFPARKAAED